MSRPGKDQAFLGLLQVVDRDRLRGGDREFLDDLAGQRVDKPRLAASQLEGVFHGARDERLPGVGGVLAVEHGHLVQGEVSQPQRLQFDVERARGPETGRVAPGCRFIVADVAQAAQRDRRGEVARPAAVAVAELAENADQTLTAQSVDLVEEQHQGPRADLRPRPQRLDEEGAFRRLRPRRRAKIRRQRVLGARPDPVEDAAGRGGVIVARRAADLAGEPQRRVPATGRQLIGERQQRRCLPRLSRGVHDEVALPCHQPGNLRQP